MQYLKIKDAILEQIRSGTLASNRKLPAERKLAEAFDTTRVTLREALSLLEAEGKIYREDRRGWFVAPVPLRYDPTRTLNFAAMAVAQQREPETKLVSAKQSLADIQATTLLNLPAFAEIYRLDRVRYLEQRPVMWVTNYIRPDRFPDLLKHDLSVSLTDLYQGQYGVHYHKTHYRIYTSSLIGDIAVALRATSGTPAMVVERVNYDHLGELIDCDIEYWRHDAIRIESVAQVS